MRQLDEQRGCKFNVEHIQASKNGAAEALSRLYDSQPQFKAPHVKANNMLLASRTGYENDIRSKNLLTVLCDGKPPLDKKTEMYVTNESWHEGLSYWQRKETTKLVMVLIARDIKEAVISGFQQEEHFGWEQTYLIFAWFFY